MASRNKRAEKKLDRRGEKKNGKKWSKQARKIKHTHANTVVCRLTARQTKHRAREHSKNKCVFKKTV